jgi:hypothetical protein
LRFRFRHCLPGTIAAGLGPGIRGFAGTATIPPAIAATIAAAAAIPSTIPSAIAISGKSNIIPDKTDDWCDRAQQQGGDTKYRHDLLGMEHGPLLA